MITIGTWIELRDGQPYNAIASHKSTMRISRWDAAKSREENLRLVAVKCARSCKHDGAVEMVPPTKPSMYLYFTAKES